MLLWLCHTAWYIHKKRLIIGSAVVPIWMASRAKWIFMPQDFFVFLISLSVPPGDLHHCQTGSLPATHSSAPKPFGFHTQLEVFNSLTHWISDTVNVLKALKFESMRLIGTFLRITEFDYVLFHFVSCKIFCFLAGFSWVQNKCNQRQSNAPHPRLAERRLRSDNTEWWCQDLCEYCLSDLSIWLICVFLCQNWHFARVNNMLWSWYQSKPLFNRWQRHCCVLFFQPFLQMCWPPVMCQLLNVESNCAAVQLSRPLQTQQTMLALRRYSLVLAVHEAACVCVSVFLYFTL